MAKPVKHGNGYRIRYVDEHGIRQSETYAAYQDAKLALSRTAPRVAEVKIGLRAGKPLARTFDDLARWWLETRAVLKRSADDDRSMLQAHLLPAFAPRQLATLSRAYVDAYVAGKVALLSPKTVANHVTLLQTMLNAAVEMEPPWLLKAPWFGPPPVP